MDEISASWALFRQTLEERTHVAEDPCFGRRRNAGKNITETALK
jgi:hypothetical protein